MPLSEYVRNMCLDVNNIVYSNKHLYQYNKSYDNLHVKICHFSVISNVPDKKYIYQTALEKNKERG